MARTASRRGASPRSYGLNDPSNFTVEEWPETKRAVYEAARELFWNQGFSETSLQQIVAQAGVTKGAFYHYFGAKEDILRVMYERSTERMIRLLDAAAGERLPVADRIRALIVDMTRVAIDYRLEVSMFWEEYRHLPPELARDNREHSRMLVRRIAELFEEGIRSGALSNAATPGIWAMSVISLCQHTPYWYRSEGAMGPDEIGRTLAAMFLNGALRSD